MAPTGGLSCRQTVQHIGRDVRAEPNLGPDDVAAPEVTPSWVAGRAEVTHCKSGQMATQSATMKLGSSAQRFEALRDLFLSNAS